MATELDALQLNFTASTSGAETSITRLIEKLDSLKRSIGLVNSGNFVANAQNIANAINYIDESVNRVDSNKINEISASFKKLSKSLEALSTAGNKIGNISGNVLNLTEALRNSTNSGVTNLTDIMKNAAQNANNANSPIKSIIETLKEFNNIKFPDLKNINNLFNTVNGLNSNTANKNLSDIVDGLKKFQNVTLPNFDNAESFTEFLRGLGSKRVVAASGAITQLATGLRQFQGMSINVSGLSELAKGISVFGRKTAQTALTTIPQLATAFRDLISTLSTAPQVSRNVIDLTNALANFVANLRNVGGGATQASRGLHLFGNTASRTSKKTFSLASAIGKVYATYFLLFRAVRKLKEAINISASVTEVQNVVDTSFGQMAYKVEEFAKDATESFGMSELSVKKFASRYQAMGTAMNVPTNAIKKAQEQLNKINPELAKRGYSDTADSFADISLNMTRLVGDLASFYDVAQEDVAKDLESILTGMSRPLKLAA